MWVEYEVVDERLNFYLKKIQYTLERRLLGLRFLGLTI